MVQGQQPLPQCDQNKGDDCELQEKEDRARPHSHRQALVEQVESFKFLGIHITNELSWSKHSLEEGTTNPIPPRACKDLASALRSSMFYSCIIDSILTGCTTAWYGNCSASDCKALQRVVRTAQYLPGAKLPAIQALYNRWCQRNSLKTVRIQPP